MSPDRESLSLQLKVACRYRDILLEQKAGHSLQFPANLQIELEEKERQINHLEAQLRELARQLEPDALEAERQAADDKYLRHQGYLCADDRVEGMAQQQFLIPQLDEVFGTLLGFGDSGLGE